MSEGASVIETPLAALHRAAGARMGEWFGCALPDDFGDIAAEERLAMESVALIDKNYRAYLAFTGPDRVRYLNAILTNNVKDLEAGAGSVSLLLNPQGRILAEIETYAFEDRLFCVSYAMIRQRLIEWLDKYIIMDDVTLTDETERFGTLALEGPKAAEVVKKLTGLELAALGELSLTETKVDGIGCRLGKRSPGGVAVAEFLAERGDLLKLWGALEAAVRREGGGPIGFQALSARRLAQGIPWFGYDFGEQQIPHEAGLEQSHISYTKGCYTGQEIVERVRSRGQVNRVRVLMKFAGSELPGAGEPLLADGKEIGRVTRSAFSHALGAVIGMGYVRRENSAEGSALQWAGNTATVINPN
ncbi:MAG TPA: glycine cleavage T C-terminal barrel domain-containing protein [Candidatus Dormibacteraeota bacterium]|nr:glycine cleavage T C-terminal barrel domain-containing protein [Candidatus Dormibacteraeota bacterium]